MSDENAQRGMASITRQGIIALLGDLTPEHVLAIECLCPCCGRHVHYEKVSAGLFVSRVHEEVEP